MKRPTTRKSLEDSCEWIRTHTHARNLDVPDHLLEQWSYESGGGEDATVEGFHLAVFSFGLLQHDLISNGVAPGVKRSFPVTLLLDNFIKWQLKLALAEIHRRAGIQIGPMPLFAFPEGEQVEVWSGGDGPGNVTRGQP